MKKNFATPLRLLAVLTTRTSNTSLRLRSSLKLGAHLPFKRRSSPRSMRFKKLTESQFRCYRKTGPVSCDSLKKNLDVTFMRPNYQHNLYYEAFQEKLSEGSLAAETLAQVISASEEENQKKNKPEPSRQLGLNLDSTLTIQTRRRYIASMPANFEELRIKYKVMSHMWLLSQMRQPGRHLFADLTDRTFSDILEELLSENMFMLQREVAGMPLVVPRWEHCLEYEFQLRKEAIRLTVEENFSIQAALWHAFEDQQHKLTHWVQLLTIANAQQACSSDEVSKLRKEVADLRKMVSQRSRSPRGKGAGKRSLPAPSQLALPAPPTSKGSGKKGKTGKGKKGSQGGKKDSSASSTSPAGITPSNFRSFDQIMLKGDNRKLFYKLSGRSICFLFQSGKCSDSACPRVHCCAGCGKAFKPYNECGCLESTAA